MKPFCELQRKQNHKQTRLIISVWLFLQSSHFCLEKGVGASDWQHPAEGTVFWHFSWERCQVCDIFWKDQKRDKIWHMSLQLSRCRSLYFFMTGHPLCLRGCYTVVTKGLLFLLIWQLIFMWICVERHCFLRDNKEQWSFRVNPSFPFPFQ